MRGTVAGEAVVSQAGTAEFREGFDRTFGNRHGRCVQCADDGQEDPIAWRCKDCGALLCKSCLATNIDCYDVDRTCLACGRALPDTDRRVELTWGAENWERLGYAPVRKPQRGRWVMTPNGLVPADEYVPEARAVDAPIIADRIHEGTTFDDGDRVRDIGSRRKRREFLKEKGLAEASDYAPGWRERKQGEINRDLDRRTHEAFDQAARKLYQQGKLR